MLLKKAQGGCSIGPYTWENDGDAVDVDYDTALALLAIPGGDFEAASETTDPDPAPVTPAQQPPAELEAAQVTDAAPPAAPTPSPLHIAEPVAPAA